MARKMNAKQCREVLNEIDCRLQSKRAPRLTATEASKQTHDAFWALRHKYGSSMVETISGDLAELEAIARRQSEKNANYAFAYGGTSTGRISGKAPSLSNVPQRLTAVAPSALEMRKAQFYTDKYWQAHYNPCSEIQVKEMSKSCILGINIDYASLFATKNRNQFNNEETKMITQTKHYIHGADVENITEGQLVDVHNDTKKKVSNCEERIKELQARIIVEKEKMVSYKDDIKVIVEHIKDKRSS